MKRYTYPCLALLTGLSLAAPQTAFSNSGLTLAIVPIPTDRAAEQPTLEIGYIARTGFDRSPSYNVFSLETLLEGQNLPDGGASPQRALLKLKERTAYDALDLTVP